MSSIVDLSYEQPLMDTGNQSSLLLYINNNDNASSVNTLQNDNFMEIFDARSALNTFEFILSNEPTIRSRHINNDQNPLTDSEKQQLINFVEEYERKQPLIYLIINFVKFFNIYLHFIAFAQGKFQIINEYSFPDKTKQKKQAFVVLNGNNTICGPLFAHDLTGRIQTVFPLDDMRITSHVYKYIEKLNRINPTLLPTIQDNSISTVHQDSSNNMLVNDASVLANDVDPEILVLPTNTIGIRTSGDQIVQKIVQTNNTSSILNTIPLPIEEPGGLLPQNHEVAVSSNNDNSYQGNTIQSNDSDRVGEADQISLHTAPSVSTHLSNTTPVHLTMPTTTSTQVIYGRPEIAIQPKQDWNSRYPTDLIPKPKQEAKAKSGKGPKKKRNTKKQTDKEKKIKFIGLLQGVGGQRSRIRVKVPPIRRRKMYLACAVRTINNQHHFLKVIVQEKTKVNKDRLNHENDLNYLEFDECNPMHFFDPNTRNVYMKITLKEYRKKLKEVPIYMFNLYQNQRLTKNMIEREQLDKCILAFWFCVKENGNYIPISPESLSWIIKEKKKKKNNDPS